MQVLEHKVSHCLAESHKSANYLSASVCFSPIDNPIIHCQQTHLILLLLPSCLDVDTMIPPLLLSITCPLCCTFPRQSVTSVVTLKPFSLLFVKATGVFSNPIELSFLFLIELLHSYTIKLSPFMSPSLQCLHHQFVPDLHEVSPSPLIVCRRGIDTSIRHNQHELSFSGILVEEVEGVQVL
ncbi:hypothetical protein Tco_0874356 [Tanacetum coccineum]|uniref:Uncharacterized protein n=1 Tax=Tanacetum coccineum TaxID=301880 RepID=A0ABQ5BLE6_9ASTR